MGKSREDRDKRAININKKILELTAELDELGFREPKYVAGAGWVSEIVNRNTGENHEQGYEQFSE